VSALVYRGCCALRSQVSHISSTESSRQQTRLIWNLNLKIPAKLDRRSVAPHVMMDTDRSAWIKIDRSWTAATVATEFHCAALQLVFRDLAW
jgi:hypothetical protein